MSGPVKKKEGNRSSQEWGKEKKAKRVKGISMPCDMLKQEKGEGT
jgi:hypothetical protein